MFAIGWLELGEAEKAQLLLEKCFKNIQGPFQVSFGSCALYDFNHYLLKVSLPVLTGVE